MQEQPSEQAAQSDPRSEGNGGGSGAPAIDQLAHNQWQGRDVEFMRSNEHSKERQGAWNADGLSGAAKEIVAGDEKAAKCAYLYPATLK